jgi:hypothetical protein
VNHESLAMQEAGDGTEGKAAASTAETEQAPAPQAQDAGAAQLAQGADQSTAPDTADTSGDEPGKPAGAHLDAPAAHAAGETEAPAPAFVHYRDGAVCLVHKGAEKIPVQVKDRAHYDRLVAEHGEAAVEILPKGAV